MADNAPEGQSVGGLYWEVGVKGAEQAKTSLQGVATTAETAAAKIESTGQAAEAASTKGASAFGRLTQSIIGSIGSLGNLVTVLGSAVLVAKTFYEMGNKIAEAMRSAADRAADLKNSLGSTPKDAEANLKKTTEERMRVEREYESYKANYSDKLAIKNYEKRLDELRKLEEEYQRQLNRKEIEARDKRIEERVKKETDDQEKLGRIAEEQQQKQLDKRSADELEFTEFVIRNQIKEYEHKKKLLEDFQNDIEAAETRAGVRRREMAEREVASRIAMERRVADATNALRSANAQIGNGGESETMTQLLLSLQRMEAKINGGSP